MDNFDNYSNEELSLLAIYALFHIEPSDSRRVLNAMTKIMRHPYAEVTTILKNLSKNGLISVCGYDWRTNSYSYSICLDRMIEVMTFLIEQQKPLTQQVLDVVGSKLSPSDLQRIIWDYIISDYKNFDADDLLLVSDKDLESALLPVMGEQRFSNMLLNLSGGDFFSLYSQYLTFAFENELLLDVDYAGSLINSREKLHGDAVNTERLRCLLDLYSYMAYGIMPKRLREDNKNHRIIAALHEAYHGAMLKALVHFKHAVSLNNRDNSRGIAVSSSSYLLLSVVNYFYMLVAFLTNTEDGKKKCMALLRASTKDLVTSAKTLYGILSNTFSAEQCDKNIAELLDSDVIINHSIGALLCMYLGKENLLKKYTGCEPKWLILRHESRAYRNYDDVEAMNKVYGEKGLLSSIYRKREWENVIDELLELAVPGSTATQKEKNSQIGYFITSTKTDDVVVKIQNKLKNGTWGAGKNASLQQFYEGTIDCMDSSDREIAIKSWNNSGSSWHYGYHYIELQNVLPYMTDNSRLYVGTYTPYTKVEVNEEMPYITLMEDSDGYRITSNVAAEAINEDVVITHRGAASISFIKIPEEQKPYYSRLLSLGYFPKEAEQQLRVFLKSLGGKVEINSELIEGGSTLPVTDGSSQLIIQMRPQGKEEYVVGLFVRPLDGGKVKCKPGKGDKTIVDTGRWKQPDSEEEQWMEGRVRVQRNLDVEKENMKHFEENCAELSEVTKEMDKEGMAVVSSYDLLPLIEYAQKNPDRVACEWPEGARLSVKQRSVTSSWNGAIKKNENGWFEIEGSIELDQDKVITMAQLLDLAHQSHGRFIKLSDGEFLALSESLKRQLSDLGAIASRSRGKLIMSPFSVALLGSDVTDGELTLMEDEEVKAIRQRIIDSSKYSPQVPDTLNAQLRGYQKEGYQWISRLNKWGAGALLADDMGLGKTIQTITFLLSKSKEGPALVVAPASVAPNWKTEFEKFAPSLNVTMLNFAPDRRSAIMDAQAGDVVVTTYGLLLSVKDEITEKQWTSICLDEAHIIKNRGAKTSAVAMQLKSQYRVMLTGTPVQNHLGELWNLFQFVNPGLLGSFEDFNRRFITPIEVDGDKDVQKRLDKLVKPFMLRRTKDKVAKELPEKQEIYHHVDLSEEELLVYEALRQKAEAMLLDDGPGKVSMNTLAEITRLRQCACDIRLTEKTTTKKKSDKDGSKIIALVELLETILESFNDKEADETTTRKSKKGHNNGILVFSQFTSYLDLIKKALDKEKVEYLYIDGAVPIKERQKLVEKFQNGECRVFLISLKAGGLGLNLTRANYVIHMDPWWNPAIEAQATDRAHRIGQKQNVTVYHLIAAGTIEEKIQRLHEQKRELVENVLESTDSSSKLTGEQLLEMLHS